jgi:hypothetical protein
MESSAAFVVKQKREFLVPNLGLYPADLLLDVPVGGENVGIAIELV